MNLANKTALAAVSAFLVLGTTVAHGALEQTAARTLTPGVRHLVLRTGVGQVANVARIDAGADVTIRPVLARDRIAGSGPRLERTSSMCARTGCIAAVNGDFFRDEIPVGAIVSAGRLLRSPNARHHQLSFDAEGAPSADHLRWEGRLVPTDLETIRIAGLNVERGKDKTVLYTRAWDRRTGTNRFGIELVLEPVKPDRPLTLLGQTTIVRLVSLRRGGDAAIPGGGAVLSGHGAGAAALSDLWRRVTAKEAAREALLRVEATTDAVESIGGTPILLRNGKVWFENEDNVFTRGRHPRTIVGWDRRGTTWLVTLDGRQPGYSDGATLAEAARLMLELGATDAINLDGGGSTTFVAAGKVLNRPSDTIVRRGGSTRILNVAGAADAVVGHVERPVANALVVVPADAARDPVAPARLPIDVPAAETVAAPTPPAEDDPGSNPSASLPAIVGTLAPPPRPASAREALLTLAILLNVAGARAVLGARRRLTRRPPGT